MGGVCYRCQQAAFEEDRLTIHNLRLVVQNHLLQPARPNILQQPESAPYFSSHSFSGLLRMENTNTDAEQTHLSSDSDPSAPSRSFFTLPTYMSSSFSKLSTLKECITKIGAQRSMTCTKSMLDRAWRTTATSIGRTYCHNGSDGRVYPLSLRELCIRCICIQLLSEPALVFRSLAYQSWQSEELRKHQKLVRYSDSKKSFNFVYFPSESATAILAWLRDRQVACKHHFQLFAYFEMLDWDLRFCSDVDDSWLEALPTHAIEQIQSLDFSYCHRLQFCGLKPQSRLPNLRVANFEGCLYLKPETIQRLGFSNRLISLNLTGCRLITDKTLYSLRHLFRLQNLHLVTRLCAAFLIKLILDV